MAWLQGYQCQSVGQLIKAQLYIYCHRAGGMGVDALVRQYMGLTQNKQCSYSLY